MSELKETSDHVASGDVEIFYRKFGRPGRMPVLIVHGLSYTSYDWIDAARLIACDREVAAMDMRGFGESTWSVQHDYKLESQSADVVAVLDALGWSRAVLMGHSFGGRVMLACATWQPERAGAYISVDFAPDLAPAGRRHVAERIGRQPDFFKSVEDAMAYHGHQDVPLESRIRRRWESFLRKTEHGYVMKRDLHYRDMFRKALETGKSAPVPDFLWPMMAKITIPTLVVRATESDMFEPQTLEKAKKLNPRFVGVEIAGSHNLPGDNPTGLAQVVTKFLDDTSL
ncbi:alpha/beta fold hydrolase [Pseudorhodoplanes sp.]|uniref:alpha/beta fold hydrolase n=1 Tax=Pseudorhodoplanes sp. TaxID=1934341 RepID=UPI003D1163BA